MGLETSTAETTLPDTWRNWVSARTGWPDDSVLRLVETANLFFSFYLGVAARTVV